MKKPLISISLGLAAVLALEAIERISRPFSMGLALGLIIGLTVAFVMAARKDQPAPLA